MVPWDKANTLIDKDNNPQIDYWGWPSPQSLITISLFPWINNTMALLFDTPRLLVTFVTVHNTILLYSIYLLSDNKTIHFKLLTTQLFIPNCLHRLRLNLIRRKLVLKHYIPTWKCSHARFKIIVFFGQFSFVIYM